MSYSFVNTNVYGKGHQPQKLNTAKFSKNVAFLACNLWYTVWIQLTNGIPVHDSVILKKILIVFRTQSSLLYAVSIAITLENQNLSTNTANPLSP